jgi:hypothetical protein
VSGRVDLVGTREGSTYRMRHPHGSRCRLRRRRRSLTRPRPPTSRWQAVVSLLVGEAALLCGYGWAHCQRRPGKPRAFSSSIETVTFTAPINATSTDSVARSRAEHVGGDEATLSTGDE